MVPNACRQTSGHSAFIFFVIRLTSIESSATDSRLAGSIEHFTTVMAATGADASVNPLASNPDQLGSAHAMFQAPDGQPNKLLQLDSVGDVGCLLHHPCMHASGRSPSPESIQYIQPHLHWNMVRRSLHITLAAGCRLTRF